MPATLIGVIDATLPLSLESVYIEISPYWDAGWYFDPDLELLRFTWTANAQDLGECAIKRRYGRLKPPYSSQFSTLAPLNLDGFWVRVIVLADEGEMVAWIGQISGERRDVGGNSTANTGEQIWRAYAPQQFLRKRDITSSFWLDYGDIVEIGWLPAFNRRDAANRLVGNRSATRFSTDTGGDAYGFGGSDLWSRYDMLEYLVERMLNTSSDLPIWSIGGQADLLAAVTDTLELAKPVSVADALAQIIDPKYGVDYKVNPTSNGFEIFVFALVAEEESFNGASLPRNPNTVRIALAGAIDAEAVSIVRSTDQTYSLIKVTGQRIVQCASLSFAAGTLEEGWTVDLEVQYLDGTGTPADAPFEHDAARKKEIYRPVYQLFTRPQAQAHATPALDAYGDITDETNENYQTTVRETLNWLPLKEGFSYADGNEENLNPDDKIPAQLPPAVWLLDEEYNRLVPADKVGISVSALPSDWGVALGASPNHRLGKNHLSGMNPTEYDPDSPLSDEDRYYDYETMIATIAWRLDHPLQLSYAVPNVDDGSVKEIFDPEAELWILANNTVVDVEKSTGAAVYSGPERVLRNDSPRLALLMAGAIARYARPRSRASITLKGIKGWSDLVGQILTIVDDGGDIHDIQAPITSVEVIIAGETPTTIIKTGFAR